MDGDRIGGRSMRAGAATDLFDHGVPEYMVKLAGRWKSDAVLVYWKGQAARATERKVEQVGNSIYLKWKEAQA